MPIYLLPRTRQFGKSRLLGTLKDLFDELEAPQPQERSVLSQCYGYLGWNLDPVRHLREFMDSACARMRDSNMVVARRARSPRICVQSCKKIKVLGCA